MSLVIEFEGFQCEANRYIVKELAYYRLDDGNTAVYHFQPPFEGDVLKTKKKQEFIWVMQNLHSLSWYGGDYPYEELHPILMGITTKADIVYTKGLQKAKFLEHLLERPVFNLEDLCCPKAKDIQSPNIVCKIHTRRFHHCALYKATAFGLYMKTETFPKSTYS